MKCAYHTLTLVSAPEKQVREAIQAWLQSHNFTLVSDLDQTGRIEATYKGYSLGITDRQTSTRMQILLTGNDGLTAVSIYHRTTRLFFIVGLMVGNRLCTEAESLVQHLQETSWEER